MTLPLPGMFSSSCRWELWQYGLWSFQAGSTKLERFLPKNQHTQKKLLNFKNWVNGEVSKIEHHFIIEKDSDNFWYRKLTLKVKRLGDFALFDTFSLTQFSKFNNCLWVCWFLGKNLSNFVPPVWKLHNPYCHSQDSSGKRIA